MSYAHSGTTLRKSHRFSLFRELFGFFKVKCSFIDNATFKLAASTFKLLDIPSFKALEGDVVHFDTRKLTKAATAKRSTTTCR